MTVETLAKQGADLWYRYYQEATGTHDERKKEAWDKLFELHGEYTGCKEAYYVWEKEEKKRLNQTMGSPSAENAPFFPKLYWRIRGLVANMMVKHTQKSVSEILENSNNSYQELSLRKRFSIFVDEFDHIPANKVVSILAGCTDSVPSGYRSELTKIGYEFLPINDGADGYKVVKRPDKKSLTPEEARKLLANDPDGFRKWITG